MKNFLLKKLKKQLIIGFSKRAGKNFFGRKTIFTQGGGLFKKLRLLNFKRNFLGKSLLISIEKDINRTAFIGLLCYENGLFCYILLSSLNYKVGHTLLSGFSNYNNVGVSTFLLNIPTGNIVHHVEYNPMNGGKISRSAGVSSFIISRDLFFTYLKMNSGWLLKLSNFCIGIPGHVSNEKHFYTRVPKAGKVRQLGFKPTVRGISKNPCDHPHGGGEGRGSPKKAQRTPWGKLTKTPTKKTKRFYLKKKKFKIFKKK